MDEQALVILKKHWGYNYFLDPQADIIRAVTEKKNVLALLPTGAGKSICFQVPALLSEGICVVISPLIALMSDQVNQLKNRGIKAIALSGGLSFQEVNNLLDNCIYGNYKFLYLSPERLRQEWVLQRILQLNINLIAIDEAHCISQWGHDFRPAYLECHVLGDSFPETPIIALTASATKKVREDILSNLKMESVSVFKKSMARPNIVLQVLSVTDKRYTIIKLMQELPGPSIIYVRNRKATVEISTFLNQNGFKSLAYHGGLSAQEKKSGLERWLKAECNTVVATNAFGMGIDKPDVRNVIHIQLPESLESYYQEAGRAGRDNLPSRAVILTNETDIHQLKKQFLSVLPDKNFVKLLYKNLNSYFQIAYGEGSEHIFRLRLNEFCLRYKLNTSLVYNGLRLLDKHSVISLSENYNRQTAIQFKVSNKMLFKYMDKNPSFVPTIQSVLRTYGGIFDIETKINTLLLSKKTGLTESKVLNILEQLEKDDIINYSAKHTDIEIIFLVPREDNITLNKLIPYIELYNQNKKNQIRAVIDYIKPLGGCKNAKLLKYFGEDIVQPCGKCSACTTNPVSETPGITVEKSILEVLKNGDFTSRELIEKIGMEEHLIIEALRSLLDKGRLEIDNTNKYHLS